MVPEQAGKLEYILGRLSVGVVILDSASLCIHYVNSYLQALLDEPWNYQDVRGHPLEKVIPTTVYTAVAPLLQHVSSTGQHLQYEEIPYEGSLETRGRTYWRISIERSPFPLLSEIYKREQEIHAPAPSLLITVEDVTDTVRSRSHLEAIYHVSSAIAGASVLPQVLDRILQALQNMVGSKRCAILLVDHSGNDIRIPDIEESQRSISETPPALTIAAQKGIHHHSYDWHPLLDEHTLLGLVVQKGSTVLIPDTNKIPNIELPYLDEGGFPYRPGSVLCVPIFESSSTSRENAYQTLGQKKEPGLPSSAVLGCIEVYHIRARGFPSEEVELLEQFSLQAGLAIQNARLFRSIDQWARVARRNAHQRENVMQAMPDSIVIFDPRWRVASANHAARKLFGWNDEVLGMSVVQALACSTARFQTDLGNMSNLIEDFERRALKRQTDEIKIVGADGCSYTLSCSYTPILDDLGDIFAFIIVYHDMTEEAAARERIEAEVIARTAELAQRNQALQEAKAAQELASARMELLLERLPSGVILISAEDNSIVLINSHATQLLQNMGLPLEPPDNAEQAAKGLINQNAAELFRKISVYRTSGSLVPYEESPLALALNEGAASEAELHTTMKNGQMIHLLVNAAPLRAIDGTISSAIVVLHEITTIKALERAREDFFTTMTHELKTPLANIRAHLSALLAKDLQWSSDEQYDFLQTADEQVERLVGMVNHFLNASRIEAGALRLELEPILLPEMMEDLQDRLEALIASSMRSLQLRLPQQLPAVLADYELIMSVLTNLLSNAFRYAPEGDTVFLDVEPVFEKDGQQPTSVILRVTDRGPGMSPEQQQELFTRFSTFAAMSHPAVNHPEQSSIERRRAMARWSPATGLGLYISRGIIEAHGSTLTLQSSPGQGATFAFTLPVFVGKRGR